MSTQRPILRNAVIAAGLGTSVLLLHGSASSSAMWTPVINALKARFRLIAPDLIGYGRTDAWSEEYEFRLDDELRLIEPFIAHQPGGSHVVAHSYGGVVALALVARGARRHSLADTDRASRVWCSAQRCAGKWTGRCASMGGGGAVRQRFCRTDGDGRRRDSNAAFRRLLVERRHLGRDGRGCAHAHAPRRS